jgi:hypothetical protein
VAARGELRAAGIELDRSRALPLARAAGSTSPPKNSPCSKPCSRPARGALSAERFLEQAWDQNTDLVTGQIVLYNQVQPTSRTVVENPVGLPSGSFDACAVAWRLATLTELPSSTAAERRS